VAPPKVLYSLLHSGWHVQTVFATGGVWAWYKKKRRSVLACFDQSQLASKQHGGLNKPAELQNWQDQEEQMRTYRI